MDQDEPVERLGEKSPPESEPPKIAKRARRAAGAKAPPAPSPWLRPLDAYDRRERREFQVARFGDDAPDWPRSPQA
jgi:hypothetical protein